MACRMADETWWADGMIREAKPRPRQSQINVRLFVDPLILARWPALCILHSAFRIPHSACESALCESTLQHTVTQLCQPRRLEVGEVGKVWA